MAKEVNEVTGKTSTVPANTVAAYEVCVRHPNGERTWARVINARSAGAAKYEYFLDLQDPWPDIPYTALRVRCVSKRCVTPTGFARVAEYRGVSYGCGDRVRVGERQGVVVGHNDSSNFQVLMDGDRYPGNVHPGEIVAL